MGGRRRRRWLVLPVRGGPELKLRCVVRPAPGQAALLDRLGIELPLRLTIKSALAEM